MSEQDPGPMSARTPAARAALDAVEKTLEELIAHQEAKVVAFARRLRPGLTPDDVKNPHDFDELVDPDFNYEDGQLAGLQFALSAMRRTRRDLEQRAGEGEDGQEG
jgi:hypothetical protein